MAKLAAYQAKRDFAQTAEPSGDPEDAAVGHAFVVQKHDATRLHYDLRLELDGAMKSWAVAKGPSLVPGEKRLAVHVEDHPVSYNTFEGTIPKGQYGGGTVMVWDRGTWAPEGDPHKGYAKGHLDFRLDGEKLSGRWHLVRLRRKAGEKAEPWILIKSEDEHARAADAPDILDEKPLSAATGRSLDEIAAGAAPHAAAKARKTRAKSPGARVEDEAPPSPLSGLPADAGEDVGAQRRRMRGAGADTAKPEAAPPHPTSADAEATFSREGRRKTRDTSSEPGTDPLPATIEPCLATLVSEVPKGDLWLHEIKWDGYRLLAFRDGERVTLQTRRGLDWTHRFPRIAAGVAALPARSLVVDGEAVVEDERGIASFSALQAALSEGRSGVARDAILFAFDLLYLDGHDLRALPLAERKARLATLLSTEGDVRLSEHLEGEGAAMVRSACRLGLEGIISKRRDRPYRSGRGEDWVKIKCTERQEFVIGGYVPSSTGRKAVGSLLLGYNEGGRLVHAGRAGTGFTTESARDLWKTLDPATRKTSPFAGKLTTEEKRGAVFVEPARVAEIEFRGWTADERLRHAAFKGLRDDKLPADVVRERPADLVAAAPASPAPAVKRNTAGAADTVAGVRLTHPDRVLWEDTGLTKRGLAEFYEAIAPWLLREIAGRPLSLLRCPAGVSGPGGRGCFFQKHSWAGLSEGIRRETVRDEGGEEEVLYVETIAGVVGLVQAGVLEIHPWGSRIDDVERADRITMDLDPGDGVVWADVCAAAQDVRARLRAVGLESFVKTTGGKGLHVVLPFRPGPDWASVKGFAHALALAMEADDPGRYIARATKAARRGVIYVDYLRNGRGATAVAAYSTRARPRATVSVPVAWEELGPGLAPDGFTVATLPARLARLAADPWAALATTLQDLPVDTLSPARKKRARA